MIVERTDAPSSAMPFDAKQPSAVLTTQVRAGAYRVTVYPPQAQAESWLPVEEILEVSAPGFQEPYRMAFELGGHLQLQWEGSLASEWEAGRMLRLELLPEGTDRNYWLEAGGGFLSTRLPWSIPSRGEPFDPAKRPLEDGPLLSAGAYRLVVHGPGLQPEEVRIQIVAGEMAQAVLPLEPAE